MPRKAAAVATPPVTVLPARIDQDQEKAEAQRLTSPLAAAVGALQVTNNEEYQEADTLLARIRAARKTWGDRLEKIIRPIRTGLDEIYALNREGDKPLAALEDGVKHKMKVFKLEEQRQLQAAQNEQDRLNREADEARRRAEAAATPQLAGRLMNQAARAEQKAQTVYLNTPLPVAAAQSTTRPVKGIRVKDPIKFHKGIAEGYIPLDVTEVRQGKLNTYLKEDPEGVECWPGIEVYDDVQIVGR